MVGRRATRSQILVALRRSMPNVSVRRLGDLIDRAKLIELNNKDSLTATVAFGFVLDGTVRVAMEGAETRWVGPGELFGMARYDLDHRDHHVELTSTTKTAHYLAFSDAEMDIEGFLGRVPHSP